RTGGSPPPTHLRPTTAGRSALGPHDQKDPRRAVARGRRVTAPSSEPPPTQPPTDERWLDPRVNDVDEHGESEEARQLRLVERPEALKDQNRPEPEADGCAEAEALQWRERLADPVRFGVQLDEQVQNLGFVGAGP